MNETTEAIAYFEDAIRESDEIIKECSLALQAELNEQKEHFVVGVEALREQAERSKGCVWCKSDSQVTHNGEHFCFFCSYCGKRLEVESIDAGTIGGEMVQRALKKLEVKP
jgi:hypothetical protein